MRRALDPRGAATTATHTCGVGETVYSEEAKPVGPVPSYLRGYEDLYRENPRAAALTWFAAARYGLFLHFGLYSLLGRHEWVQFRERIPVAEYAKLMNRFRAERFDAEYIVSFAADCGMRYVNITTRHHDSFCLFETAETPLHVGNSPAGRDLVGELAAACARHGIGLFLYYSHGRDWRHPHAPNNDAWGGSARPAYDPPEPSYATGTEHDLDRYLAFMDRQVTELLTRYGPVAGIWLDGIAVPQSGDAARFRCQELYDRIHALQPQVLVSYKQGLLGTEDFVTPEHRPLSSLNKPGEICTTMIPSARHRSEVGVSWGHLAAARGKHKTANEVWETLGAARRNGYNLLLNTAPLPDGAIDPEDDAVLREVGARLRREGFPEGGGTAPTR